MTELPEEDKWILHPALENPVRVPGCVHDWVDTYNGSGISKHDPHVALITFFCKKCLKIVVKSYSQAEFYLNQEFIDEFEEQE